MLKFSLKVAENKLFSLARTGISLYLHRISMVITAGGGILEVAASDSRPCSLLLLATASQCLSRHIHIGAYALFNSISQT